LALKVKPKRKKLICCPMCGSGEYLTNKDGNRNHFCGQCGQAIEWGEDDG
jgi:ribosomal protein S27AE